MPRDKRSKNRNKKTRALPSVEQPKLQHVKEQQDHPGSHLICSDSNDTGASWDIVAPISLDGTQTHLSKGSLSKRKAETQDGKCLQSSTKKHIKQTKQSYEKHAQHINIKTSTQTDDETLLNVIKSADLDQAVQLLKGNNHFSQDGLDRALISACCRGPADILVQELICLGANVQFKDTLGNTPLLICAENGFIDIVRSLLKMKADVNASNSVGDTALILSIRPAGSLEMVRVLLYQNGIDISHQNRDGYTALMKAVEVKDVDVIKILMDRYKKEELDGITPRQVHEPCCLPSIEAVNSKGMTAEEIADKCGLGNIYNILKTHTRSLSPLMIATERRDTESLNILLDSHFVEKEDIQDAFVEILHQFDFTEGKVLTEKEIVIVKRLFECGAVVDISMYGDPSPLSKAVKMGDYDLVELFCQHIDQQQPLGYQYISRELIEAATSGRCDIINLLLKYDAQIDEDQYEGSAQECALTHGHFESAKLLVQHGAKMDIAIAFESAVTQQLPEYMNFVLENCQPKVLSYAVDLSRHLNKLFLSACRDGNLEIIGCLLDAGANVNHDVYGNTPLGESKDGDVARFLINRGANVNLQLHDGDTILITILNKRNFLFFKDSSRIQVVKVLLENGASVNESGNADRTPLMVAASREESVAMLQILLDHGADINGRDKRGNTALMIAAHESCPLNVLFLLAFHKEKNLDINVQNNEGKTALMYAVSYANPEIVKQLIDFGADLNIKDEKGNTPLLHALIFQITSREILPTLMEAEIDVNCQNNKGISPLMMAASRCRKDGLLILLDSGADVNALSEKDSTKTALSFLSDYRSNNFKVCLDHLLKKGASLSYMKPDLLHRMIHSGNIYSIPDLIRSGVVPTEATSENPLLGTVSPLCLSLLLGNVSLAHYFVGNLFLTISDVTSLPRNKFLYQELERRQLQDCLNYLEELSSQPFSLFQLAFMTVLSAVGSSPGRESRVNMLPLPQVMKDKLLFKTQKIQLNNATKECDYSKTIQGINTVNQFNATSTDWDEYSDSDYYFFNSDPESDSD